MTKRDFKLTFVINTAAFLVSHRLALALRLKRDGRDVRLITGQAGGAEQEAAARSTLAKCHIEHRQVAFGTSSVNPAIESWAIGQIVRLLKSQRPDIVHCASPKGVLYGGLAARLAGVPGLVLAISGMGYAFTSTGTQSLARRAISLVYRRLAKLAFGHRNKRVIVQNEVDRDYLLANGLAKADEICQIPGSGVHLPDFAEMAPESKQAIVLLPARMLIDKGVQEFVEAARRIRMQAPEWRFVLAGAAGYLNPSSIPLADIEAWQREGAIEWLGHVDDMLPLYRDAAIVCLPSYREGMPKSLLEAAAAGCAVVTTDTVGCRDAIIAGESGDLVPVEDAGALAQALLALIADKGRRERYGHAGQAMAAKRFGLDAVIERTLALYDDLLTAAGR